MKSVFGCLAALVCFASLASAQDIPDVAKYDPQTWWKAACPTCGVHSSIDWVQVADIDGAKHPLVAGWGFECVSGQPADRVDVHAFDPSSGLYVTLKTELRWQSIQRMDVYFDQRKTCPTVTGTSGFGAVVLSEIPEHATRLKIVVWRGPYSQVTSIPILTR